MSSTSATSPAALQVVDLHHQYRTGAQSSSVLNGVSLTVSAGESVALPGPSGSGKSTLLNLISGLESIQRGDVRLFGHSLKSLNDRERTLLRREHIGFVYQSFNLIPTLSVADNIALPLALAGTPRAEQQQRVGALLDNIRLPGRGQDFPDQLSGGEQQRVAIARAVIHQPALILADEPTGNLDVGNGQHVLDLLLQLVSTQGAALLLVTHSLAVASVTTRTLRMQDGRLHSVTAGELSETSAW